MHCTTTVLVVRVVVAPEKQNLVGPPDGHMSLTGLARPPASIDRCRVAARRGDGGRLARLAEPTHVSSATLPTKTCTA